MSIKPGWQAIAALVLLSMCGFARAADLRLVTAAKNGDRSAVRALLKAEVDVNAPQADGATPLSWAVYHDDAEMAALLIAAGANANLPNEYGITPLWLA